MGHRRADSRRASADVSALSQRRGHVVLVHERREIVRRGTRNRTISMFLRFFSRPIDMSVASAAGTRTEAWPFVHLQFIRSRIISKKSPAISRRNQARGGSFAF
jgi:hypothetical protein